MIDNVKEFYNPETALKYQNYDHNLYLDEIDCKKKLTRLKEIIHCDDKGNVINSHKFGNNKEWKVFLTKLYWKYYTIKFV